MRSFDIDIEVFGERVLNRRLVRMADRTEDARPAFLLIALILERAMDQNFKTQGAHGGQRWPDLKPSTVAGKRASKDSRVRANAEKVLMATGLLARSLRSRGRGHVKRLGKTQMRWGSSVPYGVYHQSTAPRRKLPHRPLRLAEQDKREAVRALQAHVFGRAQAVAAA